MDYWTRTILVSMAGIGLGFLVGYFFGNHLFWSLIFLAVAIATDSSFRTIKNVGPRTDSNANSGNQAKNKKPLPRPPRPRF